MKLFWQIHVLQIFAVAGVAVSLGTPLSASASSANAAPSKLLHRATEESKDTTYEFKDMPAIATLHQPPQGGECGATSMKADGLTAWQRGYQQAMSGQRYRVLVHNNGTYFMRAFKACSEYNKMPYTEADGACCMAGFGVGYADLQQIIFNWISQAKPAPDTPEAQSCYKSFGEGKTAAAIKCKSIKRGENACDLPAIDREDKYTGCSSIGYLVGLRQCPAIKKGQDALKLALDNGALTDLSSKNASLEEIAPAAPDSSSSASSGRAPDVSREPAPNDDNLGI
jgi:hypothetical protein